MGYKKILLRNGLLQVEKYYGNIEFNDILNADTEAYDISISSNNNFLMLADVSEATFLNISYSQFEELFEIVNDFSSTTNGMRHAFYTGNMNFEDFRKVSYYLELANEKALSMVSFAHIDMAYEWLGVSEEESKLINSFLFQK